MTFVTFLGLLLLLPNLYFGKDFGYDGNRGPSHWGDYYSTCVGKHQSPINIEEHNVKNVNLPPLKFVGLGIPRSAYLTNNGHTVMLRANESEAAMVSGGPLGDRTYVFEQLHFHWGENDREGSEDLINNHSFAMELHAVFYNQEYGSMSKAIDHSDGLTVLAYFYEADDIPNPTYEDIVDAIPGIEPVGARSALRESLPLEKLLVPDPALTENYFTYNGSLTTPPCSEVVIWIDFKDSQKLSHEQLAAFRNVRTPDGQRLTHNFRPVQPLEDRLVFHNLPYTQSDSSKKHHHHHHHPTDEPNGQRPIALPISIAALGALFLVLLFAI